MATKRANWQDIRSHYRKHWAAQDEASRGRWEEYEPYYQYGWEARNDSRYHGRSWHEVEADLQEQWEHRHPDLPWERAHGPIRAAWEDDGPTDETQNASERTLPLREEELRAHKERVKIGEVTIRKDVVSETRTLEVPVLHEEVVIEVRPVAPRPASGDSLGGKEIRVPVHAEQVELRKQLVVTQEVHVGRNLVEEPERLEGTVQKEVVRVEKDGEVPVHETL